MGSIDDTNLALKNAIKDALADQKVKIFDRVDDIITSFCIDRDIKDVGLRNLIFDLKKEFEELKL